jgi:putative oxidoreductase
MTSSVVALLLRIGLGLTFLFAGLEKVLGGIAGVVTYFRDIGIPWPELLAPFVAYLELLGGVALLVGLLAAPIGVLFAAEMVVAILVVRLPEAMQQGSVASVFGAVRLEVMLIVGSTCLVLLGAGRWSIDAVLSNVRSTGTSSATGRLPPAA